MKGRLVFDGERVMTEAEAIKLIPKNTPYCYSPDPDRKMVDGRLPIISCPFWTPYEDHVSGPVREGFCLFLGIGDREEDGTFLLFDQVKECGISSW